MKTKKRKHHLSIHQRVERLCHHQVVLTGILLFMSLSFLKYEIKLFGILHELYNQGFGLMSSYTHHDEVTRMPVQYGSSSRNAPISGE